MFRGAMTIALALGLLAPATASAAKPAAVTGAAASVTPTTATLNGRVDANRKDTTYFFQIGTSTLYEGSTGLTAAGAGAAAVNVSVPVTGLAPATRYHYRLIAQNADGIAKGADRTFKTKPQPLALALAATPNPVAPGGSTTLFGQLTGTNSAKRLVALLSNPWPYTQGFVPLGNPQETLADGSFSFPVLSVPLTTQYQVVMPGQPGVVSPIVFVGAALQVKTRTRKVDRGRHSVAVRFRGSVAPARDGARVNVQKLRNGVWTTIAHTRAKNHTAARSSFSLRVRIGRSGDFRVAVESAGDYVTGAGRTIGIRVRR